ncbi:MAG: alkaline phosphatase [Saprospiraceae bacterium]|nr:alkaline phosphatase [Saprospiraceae bacterium]
MKVKKLFFLIGFFMVACSPAAPVQNPVTEADEAKKLNKRPLNIILMIGDGMGLTQISAGLYRNGNKLNLERFPVIGLHKSYSSSDLVTDSAAGATAFASGVKTYNGAVGVDKDAVSVPTILEEAESKGLATGLVVTSSITHATPAAFYAHVRSRDQYEDIAADFMKTDIDLFIGGGRQYFERRKTDDRDLWKELEAKNYVISALAKQELSDVVLDFNKNFGFFTAEGDPVPTASGRDYLPAASRLAPVFLNQRSKSKGFFLMIEGSRIDWGGHANDSQYIIDEMLDFDKAIGAVLDFAAEDGNTLVIVTADHETGGYAIMLGSSTDSIVPGFTTKGHTASMIPVFAYGPGAELFGGIYENTAIFKKMRAALNF